MKPALAFLHNLQDACGGQIPFERFMHAALYHPEFGYYTTSIRQVGHRGDFSTWPSMEATPARTIAAWIRAGHLRHTIEIGAGSGQLAAATHRHLGFFPRLRHRLHIVEISPILKSTQQQVLHHRRVTWHDSVAAALQSAQGTADIYSNELIDAFPCRVFIRHQNSWKELALRINDSTVQEIPIDTELPDSTALALEAPDGSRVEVHSAARDWLAEWRPHWKSGRLLTIDYGGSAPSIYHRRPHGTLRAYAHQQRLTGRDIYAAFGKRDITADVNFDDLDLWGRQLALRTTFRGSFRQFAARFDIPIPTAYEPAADAFFILEQEPDTSARTSSPG